MSIPPPGRTANSNYEIAVQVRTPLSSESLKAGIVAFLVFAALSAHSYWNTCTASTSTCLMNATATGIGVGTFAVLFGALLMGVEED